LLVCSGGRKATQSDRHGEGQVVKEAVYQYMVEKGPTGVQIETSCPAVKALTGIVPGCSSEPNGKRVLPCISLMTCIAQSAQTPCPVPNALWGALALEILGASIGLLV